MRLRRRVLRQTDTLLPHINKAPWERHGASELETVSHAGNQRKFFWMLDAIQIQIHVQFRPMKMMAM